MKKFLIIVILTTATLVSCTKKKTSQSTDNQLSKQEIKEVEKIETENKTLDEIQNEIEKSSNELDAILEEMDK